MSNHGKRNKREFSCSGIWDLFQLGTLVFKLSFVFSTIISMSSCWRQRLGGKDGNLLPLLLQENPKFLRSAALLYKGFVLMNSRAQILSNYRSGILSLPFLLIFSLTDSIWALSIWLDSLQLIPPHQDKGTAGQILLTEHLCLPYAWIGVAT